MKKTINRPTQIKVKAGTNKHRIVEIHKAADADVVVVVAEAQAVAEVDVETTIKQQIQTQIPKEKHT